MLNRARPNWLKAWALRLAVLRGKKRATVALARVSVWCFTEMARRFAREAAMACRRARLPVINNRRNVARPRSTGVPRRASR